MRDGELSTPGRWPSRLSRCSALAEAGFSRLIRLFMGRMFSPGNDTGEGELSLSMGFVLALLPLPGAFYSVFLFEKYSTLLQWMRGGHLNDPATAAIPEQYFFIVLSMATTGILAVWRWDAIFPDGRDYVNLVPLPITTRTIFLANFSTVFLLALLLAIDVNSGSAVLFPLALAASIDSFSFFLHFLWVHVCVVVAASVFTFLSVMFVIGLFATVFPQRAFRRASPYIRAAIVGCLVAMLAGSFTVPAQLEEIPGSLLRFLPSVWFVGLAQRMRVGTTNSPLAMVGRSALPATLVVLLGATLLYLISYRKSFMQISEANDKAENGWRDYSSWMFRALDATVLRSPFQRAGYRYAIKTLLRSEQHSLVVGGAACAGVVIAAQFAFSSFDHGHLTMGIIPAPSMLALPLVLSYFMILGVRFAMEVPADIRANWIFQLYLNRRNPEASSLATKIILSFIVPLLVIAVPLYTFRWGMRVGALQGFVLALWSYLLTKFLVLKFRKLPFTCPYPLFRESGIVMGISYVLGFFLFVVATSYLEVSALVNRAALITILGIVAAGLYLSRRLRQEIPEVDLELIFAESLSTNFELLNLSSGS